MKQALRTQNPIGKYLFYSILVALTAYALFSIYASTKQMYWDFPNYYVSSRLVAEGEPVHQFYDNNWFEGKAKQMGIEQIARFTPFPPVTSVLMLPLSGMNPLMAKRVWVLINVILLILAIRLTSKVFGFNYELSSFFVVLSGASLALNFRLGQFYLLILLLLLVTYKDYQKGRFAGSALLLSAITIIKYFPLVFISGFLKRKYLLYFGLGLVGLFFTQWALFGANTLQIYAQVLIDHFNGSIEGQGQHPIAFQSFSSLYANIFLSSQEAGVTAIVDWPNGKTLFHLITLLLIGLASMLTIRKVYHRDNSSDFIMIIAGMASLTALPASASYHYVLLLFPFLLLMKHQLKHGKAKMSLLLIALFAGVCNASLIPIPTLGIGLLDLILDYPRLWLMTALFLMSLKAIGSMEVVEMAPDSKKLTYESLLPMADQQKRI